MSEQFSGPASATGINWQDYLGALLLFTVKSIEHDVNTRYSPPAVDAVKVAIDVLDGPNEGDGFAETLVFPKILQAQLGPSVGGRVLGRLGQGEAKAGQTAPWKLMDPTEADGKLASTFLAATAVPDKPPF